jgi:plastocyanin
MLADRPLALAVALAAALALPACGETTRIKPSAHATPRNVPSVPSTVNPAPTKSVAPVASESGAATPSATETKKAAPNTVLASGTTFDPAKLTVKKGTKVTWTIDGYHTVTGGDPAVGPDPKSPMKAEGGLTTYAVTFTAAGTYKYFCVPHKDLGMTGEIVVT